MDRRSRRRAHLHHCPAATEATIVLMAVADRGRRRPGTVRATWRGVVLAESTDTVHVEGNHYFPPDSVRWECMVESPTTSLCFWKGRARYLSVAVDDEVLPDAAWYYPRPWPLARRIADRVAFWGAVRIEDHR